jgi:dienelactone hydrolase
VQVFVMRHLPLILALLLPACAVAQRGVTLPGPDGVTLQAELYLPDGPVRGPAVLALHGCAGFRNRAGEVTGLYRDWARLFNGRGQAVLLPDSFASRGQGEQCTQRNSTIRPGRERRQDAIAAAQWMAAQPWGAQGVVAMGWSHGGSTVLWTAAFPESAPIRAYVAMYPGCTAANRTASWRSAAPMLLLIGQADDWTPSAPCEVLAGRNASAVTFHAYPGAHHGFDAPNTPLTERSGLNTPSGRAHIGTDHPARDDARVRVPAFIDALPR